LCEVCVIPYTAAWISTCCTTSKYTYVKGWAQPKLFMYHISWSQVQFARRYKRYTALYST